MTVLVSVVVPTFKRPHLLDRCLQALLSQTFPPANYEIIIVDDGPEDEATRNLVSEWQMRLQSSAALLSKKNWHTKNGGAQNGEPYSHSNGNGHTQKERSANPLPVPVPVSGGVQTTPTGVTYQERARTVQYPRIFYLPAYYTHGPAAARNLGWRFASGHIIAFTDDDTIPDPRWLECGVAAFQGTVAGVSGRVVVPLPDDPTDNDRNTTGLERSDFVTANCFYLKNVLEKVNGFDERFQMAWREDSDLYFTLREGEYTLAWADDAVVVHPVRPEPWGTSIRQQKKSFYNALIFKKHPRLYWQIIQPAPPWHFYAMAFFAAWVLISLLLQLPWLAALCGLAWLVLYARFAFQRLKHTSHKLEHVLEMLVTSLAIPFLSIYWRIRGAIHWGVFFF